MSGRLIAGRRFILSVLARVVQLVGGFASTVLLVRALDVEQLSKFYLVSALAIAITLCPLSFLHFPIQRLCPPDEVQEQTFLASLIRPVFMLFAALVASYAVVSNIVGFPDLVDLALLVCLLALGELLFAQGTNVTSVKRQTGEYFFAVTLRSAAILLFLIFMTSPGDRANGVLLIYVSSGALSFVLCSSYVRSALFQGRVDLGVWRRCFAFGWPYIVSQVFRQTVERGDRFLVAFLFGASTVGHYAVAIDMSRRLLQGVTVNARLTFVRDAIDAHDRGNLVQRDASIDIMAFSIAAVGLPLAMVVSVFGSRLVAPLLGMDAANESLAVLRVAPFVFLLEAFRLYVFTLPFELLKKTILDTKVAVAGAVTQVTLILGLGSVAGLQGVVSALLISQVVMLIVAVYLCRPHGLFGIPKTKIAALVVAGGVLSYAAGTQESWIQGLAWSEALACAVVLACLGMALVLAFFRSSFVRIARGKLA